MSEKSILEKMARANALWREIIDTEEELRMMNDEADEIERELSELGIAVCGLGFYNLGEYS